VEGARSASTTRVAAAGSLKVMVMARSSVTVLPVGGLTAFTVGGEPGPPPSALV
jgi:hypothetical protein